jgi:teichuronic acid biosynthesis glycosyltransferase TuaG
MPAYNAEATIAAAIRSVLSQTFRDFELIVIDDGSSDATPAIVEAYSRDDVRIKLFRNECNRGVAFSRNLGIEYAAGEWIAFLDADDVWLPEKLEKQLAAVRCADADLCCTAYQFMDDAGARLKRTYWVRGELTFRRMLRENMIGTSTCMVRRSVLLRHRMNETYYHEDYACWLAILRDGAAVCVLPEVLTLYRLSRGARSTHKGKAARHRWRIYRNYLKLNLLSSFCCFLAYTFHGFQKYYGKTEETAIL